MAERSYVAREPTHVHKPNPPAHFSNRSFGHGALLEGWNARSATQAWPERTLRGGDEFQHVAKMVQAQTLNQHAARQHPRAIDEGSDRRRFVNQSSAQLELHAADPEEARCTSCDGHSFFR